LNLPRPAARPRGIQLLPLIDLIFLLLAAFIYATQSMTVHRALPVELPGASSSRVEQGEHVTVTVTSGGAIYLQGRDVTPRELTSRVRDLLASDPELRISLDADRRAEYGTAVRALDALRAAGAKGVRLSVRKP
jgi:biopolymer transport protein ExbD